MTSRAIVGLSALVVLVGIGVYLLSRIPWEYGVFGVLALAGILLAVGVDGPDALGRRR